ncbi:hypothetical protein VPH46_16130, partial [Sphingomonas sp. MJ1 (PH-R8)]|uniref:hypothetical protein n=1 Tax=Sphingomonas sp. MJ1 (PH-R8) TaxID=3112950 RepID=UPI003A8BA30D
MAKRDSGPETGKLEDCSDSVSGRVTRRTTLGAICGFAAAPVHVQATQSAGAPSIGRGAGCGVDDGTERVGLYVDIPKLRFARSVTWISTTGHSVPGVGMATYTEVPGEAAAAQEATAWRTRDADGRLWEIAHQGVVFDTQFGARVD